MRLTTDYIKDRVIVDENGCWNWTLFLNKRGYGKSNAGGKSRLAHRLSYEIFIGQIPDGLDIDHLCFNERCCNPDHLRPLDPIENRKLQRSAFKTHCKMGHKLEGENLYIRTTGSGGNRQCRKCNLDSVRRYKERIAA